MSREHEESSDSSTLKDIAILYRDLGIPMALIALVLISLGRPVEGAWVGGMSLPANIYKIINFVRRKMDN